MTDPYYSDEPVTLPHLPIWNLIPRRNQAASWKCTWHGWIEGSKCAECHREHAEYLETGTWAPPTHPSLETS